MGHTATTVFSPNIDVVGDVAYVLGRPGEGNVDRLCEDVDEFGIRLYKTNGWAKYKPVRSLFIGLTGRATGSDYWRGADGKCGFDIQDFPGFGDPGTSTSFSYKLLNNQLPWLYLPPTGSNWKSRILDFDGYDSSCVPFMEPLVVFNYMVRSDGTLQIDFDILQIQNPDNLTLQDFTVQGIALANWYFGILVYDTSTHFEYFTSQNPIGQNTNLSVVFSGMNSYAGKTVQVVPFLTSVRMETQSTATSNAHFVSFNLAPAACTLTAASAGVDVFINEALWNVAGNSVSYEFELRNKNATPITINNIRITLWEDSPTTGTAVVPPRDVVSLYIPANGTQYISGSFSYNKDPNKMYFISIMTVGNNVIPFDYVMVEDDEPIESI